MNNHLPPPRYTIEHHLSSAGLTEDEIAYFWQLYNVGYCTAQMVISFLLGLRAKAEETLS